MVPLPSLRDREDRQRPLPTPRRTPSQGNSIPHQPPRGEPTRQQREIFGRIGPLGAVVLGIERGDRKSVVEGKSVSVRVDLGGRRIIKKKIILCLSITLHTLYKYLFRH